MRSIAVLLVLAAVAVYVAMAAGRGGRRRRGSRNRNFRRASSWTGRWSRMKQQPRRGAQWSVVKPPRPVFPGGPDVPAGYALAKSGLRNPGMYV